jgi:hypothetical protein
MFPACMFLAAPHSPRVGETFGAAEKAGWENVLGVSVPFPKLFRPVDWSVLSIFGISFLKK